MGERTNAVCVVVGFDATRAGIACSVTRMPVADATIDINACATTGVVLVVTIIVSIAISTTTIVDTVVAITRSCVTTKTSSNEIAVPAFKPIDGQKNPRENCSIRGEHKGADTERQRRQHAINAYSPYGQIRE